MKKIITLRGRSNTGKSATITMLRTQMLALGYVETYHQPYGTGSSDFWCCLEGLNSNGVFQKVGISSIGDDHYWLDRSINEILLNAKPDKLVTASRTKGVTKAYLNNLTVRLAIGPVHVRRKTIGTTPAAFHGLNTADANAVYAMI